MTQKYVYDEKTNSYIPVDEDKRQNNSDDKIIAMIIWGANYFLPLIAGLVAYLYYENKNEFLRNTAKESLNYGISLIIYSAIMGIGFFIFIGLILSPLVACYYVVIPLLGILKANEMQVYKPHLTIRFL